MVYTKDFHQNTFIQICIITCTVTRQKWKSQMVLRYKTWDSHSDEDSCHSLLGLLHHVVTWQYQCFRGPCEHEDHDS